MALYAANLLDEPVEFGWVNSSDFKFSRNLQFLFNDSITVPLTGMVTNPFWHPRDSEESAAQRRALAEGILRPAVGSECPNGAWVVEALLAHPEHLWKPTPEEIRRYAAFVDECKPEYEKYIDPVFRSTFYRDLEEILARLDTEGVEHLFGPGVLKKLRAWYEGQRDRSEVFRLSEFWTEVKSVFQSREIDTYLRVAGTAAFHNALSLQFADSERDISTPGHYAPHVAVLRSSERPAAPQGVWRTRAREFEIQLPLRAIADFELADVLDLREITSFREVRALFRRMPTLDVEQAGKQLQSAIDSCHRDLMECDATSVRATIRRHQGPKGRPGDRVQILGDVTGALGPIAVGFWTGQVATGMIIGMIVFGCRALSGWKRAMTVGPGGYSFRTAPDTAYDVGSHKWRGLN